MATQATSTFGSLPKAPTGIPGLDAVTGGGIPRGRTTLIVGGPGCGKTVLALHTLFSAARHLKEPGIFVGFEESTAQLLADEVALGWTLTREERQRILFRDARLPASAVHTGGFDLLGLLSTLEAQASKMRARRIVLDGLDVLLDSLDDPKVRRREVFRLHRWLHQTGLTGIVTVKADGIDGNLGERSSFVEFMADCVVVLTHTLAGRVAMRNLRITKYRGAGPTSNEMPLLISPGVVDILHYGQSPASTQPLSSERLPTGVERLDAMLCGGYYRGSCTMVSGAPGTAKSTLAGAFAAAQCRRGEKTVYASFDEFPMQLVRNLGSVSIDLKPYLRSGLLKLISGRSRAMRPEDQMMRIRSIVREHGARHVVIDPLSALVDSGGEDLAEEASIRFLDDARDQGITTFCTALVGVTATFVPEQTAAGVSTLSDTWIHLTYVANGGERNRALTIVKSRGTGHSSQVRELLLRSDGVTLADVFSSRGEVLMGTLRWEKELEERETESQRAREAARRRRELENSIADAEAQVAAIGREVSVRKFELQHLSSDSETDRMALRSREGETHIRRSGDARAPRGAKGR